MFHLAQTLPENRLALLLAQHRFKEAESFAVEYNINIDVRCFSWFSAALSQAPDQLLWIILFVVGGTVFEVEWSNSVM